MKSIMKKKFRHWLLRLTIKVQYWIMFRHATQLTSAHLLAAGWILDHNGYFVEPFIKDRDKVWVQIEGYYYRVFHSERKTFIALECSVEWLQAYLFILDKHQELKTRKLLLHEI
jgi:hypothetical protein